MDREHRPGGKTGSGPVSDTAIALARKERQKQLALESIDITKDPYIMRNHLGTFECKLCLTIHNTEGNYLAHTQGKRHQTNLARRSIFIIYLDALENKELSLGPKPQNRLRKNKKMSIGHPGYKVIRTQDPITHQCSLIFELTYPEIDPHIQPRHRFMSAYEQKVEAPDKRYQYIIFAAEPYTTISFKIPNREIDKDEGKFISNWDKMRKIFTLQFYFKTKEQVEKDHKKLLDRPAPAPPIEYRGRTK